MTTCSDVLAHGMRDYAAGVPSTANPYPAPEGPTHYEMELYREDEFGNRTLAGAYRIRVEIDFREWWLIGWNLAGRLSMQQEQQS